MTSKTLRVGTRSSPLARWQADWVCAQLRKLGAHVEQVFVATQGDRQQVGPIGAIGTQGVFTKELQRALLDNKIDLAVHSLKDLPTDVVPGLCLAAVPERGPVGDVLVTKNGISLAELPKQATVGTGSLRRRAQLLHVRPDLQMTDVRGNIDTRLRKLEEGELDALVLAEAGLDRLGRLTLSMQLLCKSLMLPAVGQGALGIEGRSGDAATRAAVAPIDHVPTHWAVIAERSMLAELRGGCLAPVGAWARMNAGLRLELSGVVLDPDGKRRITAEASAEAGDAAELGRVLAQNLLAQGAADLIGIARQAMSRLAPPSAP